MPLRPPAGFISAFFDPLNNPNAPTIGTATGGDASASVTFTAPSNTGGAAITQYYAVSNPSQITGNAASSPVTVSGLTNGTSYTFTVWALNSFGPSPYSAASGSVTPAAVRGVFSGGQNTSSQAQNVIDYITITTTGNALDFGDLLGVTTYFAEGSVASSTRGLQIGNNLGNTISYITFATTGNANDFGDLTVARDYIGSCSSSTRGLFGGGDALGSRSNVIDYFTIATVGNATDFGDLATVRQLLAGCSSTTRGIFAGSDGPSSSDNTISYVTIASTGNSTYFGDLIQGVASLSSASSNTRGLFFGGRDYIPLVNVIQYITIASTGNSTDFGDLTSNLMMSSACSSSTRAVVGGGKSTTSDTDATNAIQYVTINTLGNTASFGNLTISRSRLSSCSNGHGGL